jgi:hypothetical protein
MQTMKYFFDFATTQKSSGSNMGLSNANRHCDIQVAARCAFTVSTQ